MAVGGGGWGGSADDASVVLICCNRFIVYVEYRMMENRTNLGYYSRQAQVLRFDLHHLRLLALPAPGHDVPPLGVVKVGRHPDLAVQVRPARAGDDN